MSLSSTISLLYLHYLHCGAKCVLLTQPGERQHTTSAHCHTSRAAVLAMKNALTFSLSTFCILEAHLTRHLKAV